MIRFSLVVALVLTAWATVLPAPSGPGALAASENGKYAIKDVGVATCQLYSDEQEKKSKRFFQFVGWVTGYLSGHNRLAKDTADIAPWQSTQLLATYIASYCKKHPEARLVQATNELIKALTPGRLRKTSERIKVEAGGNAMVIYETVLRRAQGILIERGHLSGTADGVFDPATQQAFESFQQANNLEVTGLPDQRTLLTIFR